MQSTKHFYFKKCNDTKPRIQIKQNWSQKKANKKFAHNIHVCKPIILNICQEQAKYFHCSAFSLFGFLLEKYSSMNLHNANFIIKFDIKYLFEEFSAEVLENCKIFKIWNTQSFLKFYCPILAAAPYGLHMHIYAINFIF